MGAVARRRAVPASLRRAAARPRRLDQTVFRARPASRADRRAPLNGPMRLAPRLFRLREDAAIVNRMGFNNDGYAAARARLARAGARGILGVNIGPNKDSPDRIADYVAGIEVFAEIADYFTINISSPNTPGLR